MVVVFAEGWWQLSQWLQWIRRGVDGLRPVVSAGIILHSKRYLAMSGNIFCYLNWVRGRRKMLLMASSEQRSRMPQKNQQCL